MEYDIKKQEGFTLLEILISISLLAFIMLGVVTVTDDSMRISEEVTAEDEEFLQIETALSIMEWDISHLYSPRFFSQDFRYQDSRGNTAQSRIYSMAMRPYERNLNFSNPTTSYHPVPTYESPGQSSLKIFTNSHRRRREGDTSSHYSWVLYNLQDGKLLRMELSNNPYSKDELQYDNTRPQVLMDNVDSLNFLFWDKNIEKYAESVRQVGEGSKYLWGIKVQIQFKNSLGEIREIERVFRPLWQEMDMTYRQAQRNTQGTSQRSR